MTRTLFLVAVLATSLGLFAQNRPATANPAPPQSSTVEVPATNIYVVGGGLYGGGVYVVPPAAAEPASTTGISLAGRAGISLNTPVDLGVQSTLAPANPVPAYGYGYAPSGYSASAPTVAESPERVRELVPAYFVDSGTSATATSNLSLAEVAAQYRTNRPQALRTYTNADAEKLANKVSIAGAKTGAAAPPAAEPPITQTQPQAPATQPELAANANRPPAVPENPPAETATPLLPATSSYLPLLALLGLLSSGIGLWARRFLK
jgi:hypothetical protein